MENTALKKKKEIEEKVLSYVEKHHVLTAGDHVLCGLSGLRVLAAENLRAGDMSGAHEAGCYLNAWLEQAAQSEEERI